jgi:hypothetical protein
MIWYLIFAVPLAIIGSPGSYEIKAEFKSFDECHAAAMKEGPVRNARKYCVSFPDGDDFITAARIDMRLIDD